MEQSKELCDHNEPHKEAINKAKAHMLQENETQTLSELFKCLGDASRLKILSALSSGELCVCDLSETLDISQSAISHQLRLLRAQRLVRARREGKNVFYRLHDHHVAQLMETVLQHIREAETHENHP